MKNEERKKRKTMNKQKLTYLATLAATLLLGACTHDDAPCPPGEQTAAATFRIATRAEGDDENLTPLPEGQKARLYVGDRRQEGDLEDIVYFKQYEDIENGRYTLEDMHPQWYKLAFISVPDKTDGPKVTLPIPEEDSEFNIIELDYSPVLNVQKQDGEDNSLSLYRKVIDRWFQPGKTLEEDVRLERITGQLVLDMDVLKDQFRNQVTKIEVTLTGIPDHVYLHDNANGEIITEAKAMTPYTYTFNNIDWDSDANFIKYFNLLPCTFGNANTSVHGKITVYPSQTSESPVADSYTDYPFCISPNETFPIKANTRTKVHFNGLENNEFVLRYDIAPMEGSDEPGIDIADPDQWNGWGEDDGEEETPDNPGDEPSTDPEPGPSDEPSAGEEEQQPETGEEQPGTDEEQPDSGTEGTTDTEETTEETVTP